MTDEKKPKARRGFAAMSWKKRTELAAIGGSVVDACKRPFWADRALASAAGKKGAATNIAKKEARLALEKATKVAAKATDDAIRGGVGTEVKWTSESRANVNGTSKVTAQQQLADGGTCMTVTDVVIVDGEETTVPKKMCRARGASGYAKV